MKTECKTADSRKRCGRKISANTVAHANESIALVMSQNRFLINKMGSFENSIIKDSPSDLLIIQHTSSQPTHMKVICQTYIIIRN